MAESSPKGKKTLWEKEKLLIRNNFYFSHSVFIRLLLHTPKTKACLGKGKRGKHKYGSCNKFCLLAG